jgi:hypothetical protein
MLTSPQGAPSALRTIGIPMRGVNWVRLFAGETPPGPFAFGPAIRDAVGTVGHGRRPVPPPSATRWGP